MAGLELATFRLNAKLLAVSIDCFVDHEGFEPPTPRSLDEGSTTELMVPNLEKIDDCLGTF